MSACAFAQDPAFKAGVSMVEIDAQVSGKDGAIDGLKIGDFLVRDNGMPVSLRYFSHEDVPLDIVFLFELSRDMAPRIRNLILAAEVAMAEVREGDRVAVLSYNDTVHVEQQLTEDLKEMRRRLRIGLADAVFARRPFILPSVRAALNYLPPPSEPRRGRAILMFTGDAGFALKDQNHMSVSSRLWEADAILSALVIPTSLTKITHDDNPAHFSLLSTMGFNLFDIVNDVVEQTAGVIVYAGDAGSIHHDPNPNAALQRMIRQMRRRYKLYYDRPAGKPGQRRHVEIDLSLTAQAQHPGARIAGRKGYAVPKRGTE